MNNGDQSAAGTMPTFRICFSDRGVDKSMRLGERKSFNFLDFRIVKHFRASIHAGSVVVKNTRS